MTTRDTIYNFIRFLSRPYPLGLRGKDLNWVNLTFLFFIVFLFTIVTYGPLITLSGVDDLNHRFENVFNQSNTLFIVFVAIIAAPVIEEFIFRYPLKYPLASLVLILMGMALLLYEFLGLDFNRGYLLSSFIAMALLLSWFTFRLAQSMWQGFFIKYYPLIFYTTAVLFAYMHVYNFEIEPSEWYLGPLLVMPQFLLALLLGYARLKKGILAAIYLHALNNTIPMAAFLFLQNQ